MRPFYLMVAAFSISKWICPINDWPSPPDAMLGGGLTLGGVVLGFIISAKAILIASSSNGLKMLKEAGLIGELVDRFMVGTYISLLFIALNTVGFFKPQDWWFRPTWISSGVGMIYSFCRIANILFRIIRVA